jgi:SMP-30/gluconolaconase/LRE-like protein
MRLTAHGKTAVISQALLLGAASMFAAGGYILAPAALSMMSSGEVLIMHSLGGLFRYNPTSGKVARLVEGFGLYEPIDLGVASVGGSESIFVTMAYRSGSSGPRLVRYDLAGKQRGEWRVPIWKGLLTGIAIDPQTETAFVATSKSGEIFRCDLRRPGSSPVPLLKVPSAVTLGPMVFDKGHRHLLVGDAYRGVVVSVDVISKRTETLARDVGETSALTFDANAGQLFIADPSGRRIWKLDAARRGSKPEVFIALKEFREPLGLALAADGSLWVGDRDAKTLFRVSREGKVLSAKKFD